MLPQNRLIGYAFGLVALFFAGYVLLSALGRDASSIVGWITLFLGQGLTTLAILNRQNQTEGKVDTVVAHTDGILSTLVAAKTQPED